MGKRLFSGCQRDVPKAGLKFIVHMFITLKCHMVDFKFSENLLSTTPSRLEMGESSPSLFCKVLLKDKEEKHC